MLFLLANAAKIQQYQMPRNRVLRKNAVSPMMGNAHPTGMPSLTGDDVSGLVGEQPNRLCAAAVYAEEEFLMGRGLEVLSQSQNCELLLVLVRHIAYVRINIHLPHYIISKVTNRGSDGLDKRSLFRGKENAYTLG